MHPKINDDFTSGVNFYLQKKAKNYNKFTQPTFNLLGTNSHYKF